MEVPTIHKAYAFGLWFRGYSPNFYGLKYGTKRSSILGWVIPLDCGEVPRQLSSIDRWDVPSFGRSPIQYISHYCHIIYIIYVLPIANICNKLPYCRYCNRLPCCQCLIHFFFVAIRLPSCMDHRKLCLANNLTGIITTKKGEYSRLYFNKKFTKAHIRTHHPR